MDSGERKGAVPRDRATSGVARVLRHVLAVAAIVAGWDALLFRSGLHYRWTEPQSTTGTTRSAIRGAEGSYVPGRRNVRVLGNSRLGEGISPALADDATAGNDLNFVNAAIHPGVLLIPLASLAWCLFDHERRMQDWLVQRASWKTAVAAGAVVCILLEVLARVDAQSRFVCFQF